MKKADINCKGTVPGKMYTREEGAALLCEFQDEIIRDFRTRFNKDLVNRKYFTKDLQAVADTYGMASDRKFRDLKSDLDKASETIASWWSRIAGEERARRVLSRILPGEEMEALFGVELQDGNEYTDIDSVVVTPYGVFVIEVRNVGQDAVWDEKGFMQGEDFAGTINCKELMLRTVLKDHMNVPYYSILLIPDNKIRITDRYGKIPVSCLSTVLSDIRGFSDGRRHISSKEMQEICGILRRSTRPELVPCPVDCVRIAEEYSWFVSICSGRKSESALKKIRDLIGKGPLKRPGTEVA